MTFSSGPLPPITPKANPGRPTTGELLEGILAECKEWHETTPAQASKHTIRILMMTLEVLIFNEVRTRHPPRHHE